MAEGAVTFLLEQVTEVVLGYGKLIAGAEDEFENLKKDLNTLKAHLKQISERKNKEAPEREIERQMRDTVYEVEDTIDACLTKAIQTKGRNVVTRAIVRIGDTSLAREVKAIREGKLKDLLSRARDMAAKRGTAETPSTEPEMRIPRQDRVIGFDGEEKIITEYLMEPTKELDVITIVGIPGQGKTTLAWKVHKNETISYHYPICIWIAISQKFNSKDVFLQILKKFRPSLDTSGIKEHELADTVRACLVKERFLLVLDDVWSVEAWEEIKEVLPTDNGEGKVLITTREEKVGMRSRVAHRLRFLDEKESWTLLQYEVFRNLGVCPNHLEEVGIRIAKKCDGVPLTIIVIGGILMDQYNLYKNYHSKAKSEWELVASSVSEALTDETKKKRITDVVELSYNRLSDELRECFTYLAVFPEDYPIPATMLRGLWISEGYIVPKNQRSIEECAENNMMNLISRNLLKVEKSNHLGEVKTCRVHDMIRAFCLSKSKEENLCQEIRKSNSGELRPSASEVQKSHRLCFRSELSAFLSEKPSSDRVRSFLCFYEQPFTLEKNLTSVIPERFKKLRILESKCIKFDAFPSKVTNLVHLRYLTLFIKVLQVLPKAITELWNLQSLVVETNSHTITVKANIWIMVRLRLLKTRAALVLDSKGEGEAGYNLHTLYKLAPESCTLDVAKKAKNLKNLGIHGNLKDFFTKDFLVKLQRLEKLKLVNNVTYEPTSEELLNSFPRQNQNYFPKTLRRLTLTKTSFSWQHMSTLALIENLETLKLKDNAFIGVHWNLDLDTFPNLMLLLIHDADLIFWNATPKAFPCLRFLLMKNCDNLKEIPFLLGSTLELLDIERVRYSVVQSAETIRESQKDRHIHTNAAPFNLIIGATCGKSSDVKMS